MIKIFCRNFLIKTNEQVKILIRFLPHFIFEMSIAINQIQQPSIKQTDLPLKVSSKKSNTSHNQKEKKSVTLGDLTFHLITPYSEIQAKCEELGQRINKDYADKENPIFLGVLNGAFMFMAELLRNINFICETTFVKIASYSGTSSGNEVKELIGLSNNLTGRHVIIVEDIVDTGKSIDYLIRSLKKYEPASISISCLMYKPKAYTMKYEIKYAAFEISNLFIVGFGLDYNQMGRNYKDIYQLAN
jgi:hypoxanthine phosphoribosyltransferase